MATLTATRLGPSKGPTIDLRVLPFAFLKWAKIVSVTHIAPAYGISVEVVTVIAAPFLRRPIDGLSHADSAATAADLLQNLKR